MQGNVIWMLQTIAAFLGMGHSLRRLAYAQTLEEQQAVWNSNWFIKFCKQGSSWLVDLAVRFLALIFLNRFVLWSVQFSAVTNVPPAFVLHVRLVCAPCSQRTADLLHACCFVHYSPVSSMPWQVVMRCDCLLTPCQQRCPFSRLPSCSP